MALGLEGREEAVKQLQLAALLQEHLCGREGGGVVKLAGDEVGVVAVVAHLHQHVVQAPQWGLPALLRLPDGLLQPAAAVSASSACNAVLPSHATASHNVTHCLTTLTCRYKFWCRSTSLPVETRRRPSKRRCRAGSSQ